VKYNDQGEKVPFRDAVRWIRTEKYGEYKYRFTFNDSEPWKTVHLISQDQGILEDMAVAVPNINMSSLVKLAGSHHKAVNPKKLNDVRKQLPFIPASFQGFYLSMLNTDDTCAGDIDNTSEVDDAIDVSASHNFLAYFFIICCSSPSICCLACL
jgi:hypothetical protein